LEHAVRESFDRCSLQFVTTRWKLRRWCVPENRDGYQCGTIGGVAIRPELIRVATAHLPLCDVTVRVFTTSMLWKGGGRRGEGGGITINALNWFAIVLGMNAAAPTTDAFLVPE